MNISDIHIIVTTKVMNFLSWKKICILLLTVIILGGGVLFIQYDNFSLHKRIPTAGDNVKLLNISRATKMRIHNLVTKSDLVIGVRVLTLNFQRNVRVDTYTEIDNPDVQKVYDKFTNNRVYDVPIFTDSVASNNRILHIINGEFTCTPFKESLSYKLVPEAAQYIESICTIGIPPYNNDVSGMISIYFKRTALPEEKAEMFQVMRDLALTIYNDSQ